MSFLGANQHNLLAGRWLVVRITIAHTLKYWAVQHNTTRAVSAHNHTASLLAVNIANVNLESADAALLPHLIEVEQLGLASENIELALLAGCDYRFH